jgi:hypothetical protein
MQVIRGGGMRIWLGECRAEIESHERRCVLCVTQAVDTHQRKRVMLRLHQFLQDSSG